MSKEKDLTMKITSLSDDKEEVLYTGNDKEFATYIFVKSAERMFQKVGDFAAKCETSGERLVFKEELRLEMHDETGEEEDGKLVFTLVGDAG